MFRIYTLVMCYLLLAGCGVIPGYRERLDAARAAQQARLDDGDDAQCRQYGAKAGSDSYVACRMNLANNRRSDDIAQQQAYAGMVQSGARMMTATPTPPANHVCVDAWNRTYVCP